jgi:signal transduction histidine kinase
MPRRIRQKWRPPLALVIGGTLAAVLCLPLIGIGYFKLAGNILGWGETSLIFGLLAFCATAILAFLLWRLVLRPVYALTAHADAVRAGRTDAPLPDHFGTPELTRLGQAVDDMATTLKDREAGVRAYTDHVTHELKSPLTSLIGAAELLDTDTPEEDRARLIETIRASSRKMQEQLDALRRLATARDPVGNGPARLSEAAQAVDTTIRFELSGDAVVPIDRGALTAILTHLAQNAAAHGATRLTLGPIRDGFTICDDGAGIAEGNRSRVFDPFFTTRREHGGTGMGLTIVRTMLQAAGGHIALASSRTGARFDITFPE